MIKAVKLFLLATALFFNLNSCQATVPEYEYIVEEYTVQAGDTLDSIAREFITKNTYGQREIREFTAGIKELNNILPGDEVSQGQVIKISYWISTYDDDPYEKDKKESEGN